ncbi:MAG: glycosyl transferase family 28, partial [Chitinophagaceae bacterium]
MTSAPRSFAPVVLVAPLDWGLGHATRCIPIIQKLRARGFEVLLGGSGASGQLLRDAFPELPYHELPGHIVRYAKTGRGLLWKVGKQLPQLRNIVEAERQWLTTFLNNNRLDAVISDNRYGLHHSSLPSIFITHQLEIRTPFGALGRQLFRRFHYRLIQAFSACWVPDSPHPSLAGSLSHPSVLPHLPTRYIGPLSRFSAASAAGNKWMLAVLLSGPEPQRSIWEAQLLPQLALLNGPVLLLRGLPGSNERLPAPPNVTVLPHLPTAQLQEALSDASVLLARCGYSTVMDAAALRKRSVLVPTPGQPEQEYLARHLTETGIALCYQQHELDLQRALAAAEKFDYR